MIGTLNRTRFVVGLAAVFAAAAVLSFTAVFAQNGQQSAPPRPHADGLMEPGGPPPMMPGMGPGRRGPGMLLPRLPMRELGLTDAQRDQIKSIVEKYSSEMEPFAEQARASRIALEEAIESNDAAAIETASAAVAKVDLQFALLRAKVRAEVFEQVLTEEQRAKVGEFKARLKGEAKSTRPHRHDSERGLC